MLILLDLFCHKIKKNHPSHKNLGSLLILNKHVHYNNYCFNTYSEALDSLLYFFLLYE